MISESLESTVFEYDGTELELHLIGEHQLENAKTALTALKALCDSGKIIVSKNALKAGMAKAVNPARLELMGKNPVVLLDGAHNPNGIEALSKAVKSICQIKSGFALWVCLPIRTVQAQSICLKDFLKKCLR